ncbi:MAG: alpha/beta hydrolase [Methylotenera sp.]|nr:alpha/beta hydrolase [Oligoflexia bacterium]
MKFISGLLIGLQLLSLNGCSSLLYYPDSRTYLDPGRIGLEAENVWIRNPESALIHAWHFPAQKEGKLLKPKAMIVFFHGNAQNITSHYLMLAWLLEYGYSYTIFDYRGYGWSRGKPSPKSTLEDGHTVLKYVHEKYPELPLVIFGQSLGGAVALRTVIDLKKEIPIRLVVADSTFESYQNAAQDVLARVWLLWPFQLLTHVLLSDEYAPEGRMGEISPTPLVIMHGDRDGTIDIERGKELYRNAKEPKEFWLTSGGGHTDAFASPQSPARTKLLRKLAETCP